MDQICTDWSLRHTTGVACGRRIQPAHLALAITLLLGPSWSEAQERSHNWRLQDIGRQRIAGRLDLADGTFTITGAGRNIGGVRDEFTFVYQPVTGDVTMVARVAAIASDVNPAAKAGIMIREHLGDHARSAFLGATPGRGTMFLRRLHDGRGSQNTVAAVGAAPEWVRLERRGSTFTASRSADGRNWSVLRRHTIPMADTVLVGFAVASRLRQTAVSAAIDSVFIDPDPPPPPGDTNPPVVSITSPRDGAEVTGDIAIAADAADDAGISEVRFRVNGAEVGAADTSPPYEATWTIAGVAPGAHRITADAVDTSGNTTTSAAVTVIVPAPNTPPTVSLTAPADGATFDAPAAIALSADATDADGQVTQVDFYADGVLLGTDTSGPYGITWPDAPAGTHTLTAVARDDDGATATAAMRVITVLPPAPLPEGWSVAGVGEPALRGRAGESGGLFTIEGSGRGIDGSADQFQFVYRTASGDFDVVARVVSLDATPASAKAGVMLRTSLDADAAHASLLVTPSTGSAYERRLDTGADTTRTAGAASGAPVWFKLERRGAAVAAFESLDGATWTLIGSDTLDLPETFFVGLAVSSHDPAELAAATLESVTITPPAPPTPPTVTLTTPGEGDTFTAPASITVAANADDDDGISEVEFFAGSTSLGVDATSPYELLWESVPAGSYRLSAVARDTRGATATSASHTITVVEPADTTPPTVTISAPDDGHVAAGPVSIAATASDDAAVASVTFRVDGAVVDTDTTAPYNATWDPADAAPGSHTITAEAVDTAGNSSTSAAVTVIVPAPNVPPTVAWIEPADASTFEAPATILLAVDAADGNGQVTQVEFYANGALLATDTSDPYRYVWTNAPAGSHTLTAIARDDDGAATTSAAHTITINPDVPLPPDWAEIDIGNPTLPGRAGESGGVFTIESAGRTIWETSDQFSFVYQPVSGDIDVVARAVTLENTHAWAKAGVMIRTSLAADAAHASMFVTAGNGSAYQRRLEPGADAVHTSGGGDGAPLWVKLERRGTAVTAFHSADGTTWTMIGSDTFTLPDPFYVGLAVSSGDETQLATATFDGVAITPFVRPPQPPAVALSAPSDGATFTAPATVTMTATASDDDGIAQVEFFAGSTLLDVDATDPYQFEWTNVPAGTYRLTAVARDGSGAVATSAAHTITVVEPADTTPPSVSITAPADGTTADGPLTITVDAADNVAVATVTFRVDGTTVSVDSAAPFSATWDPAGAAPGSHTITAEAADAAGNTQVSAPIAVIVPAPNRAPSVALIAPEDGAAFTAPAIVALAAAASDSDGQVMQVEFYAGTVLLGTDATSPYAFEWSNAPQGTHSLTAVARDDDGAVTTSTARTIVITADTTAPTVAVVAPVDGTEVEGTITIVATAADNVGVSSVTFYVNGAAIGTPVTAQPYSIAWDTSMVQPGAYAITAEAMDAAGNRTTSAAVTVLVAAEEPLPTRAVFVASSNHDTAVDRYLLEIFTEGADPETATPLQVQNLGKPPVSNGECSADIAATIVGLPNGRYIATVTAIGPGGLARSAPSAPFTR